MPLSHVQVTNAIQGYEDPLFIKCWTFIKCSSLCCLILWNFFLTFLLFCMYFFYSDSIRKWILYGCNSLLQCIILRFHHNLENITFWSVVFLFFLILILHPKPLFYTLILNSTHSHVIVFYILNRLSASCTYSELVYAIWK